MPTDWTKSTHSEPNGGNCVETRRVQRGWFKSVHSGGGNDCVETNLDAGVVAEVRDTKDRLGGKLTVPAPAWNGFLASVAAS